LADLEEKKVGIEQMIRYTKQILGMSVAASTPETAARETNGGSTETPAVELGDSPFLGMSVPDAVRKYLRSVKRKQSTTEIVEALERGGFQHVSQNFWKTVYTTLNRVWETQGDIVQVDGSNWALAEWFPGRKFEKPKKQKGKVGRKPRDAKKTVVKAVKAKPQKGVSLNPDDAEDDDVSDSV
jgi:hypothetical protein